MPNRPALPSPVCERPALLRPNGEPVFHALASTRFAVRYPLGQGPIRARAELEGRNPRLRAVTTVFGAAGQLPGEYGAAPRS